MPNSEKLKSELIRYRKDLSDMVASEGFSNLPCRDRILSQILACDRLLNALRAPEPLPPPAYDPEVNA